jgi:hypothetical protein
MTNEEILLRLNELIEKLNDLLETQKSNARNLDEWVDKEETMKILECSERTLQTLRDNKLLPFSPPLRGKKYFYKRSDILQLFESGYTGRRSQPNQRA